MRQGRMVEVAEGEARLSSPLQTQAAQGGARPEPALAEGASWAKVSEVPCHRFDRRREKWRRRLRREETLASAQALAALSEQCAARLTAEVARQYRAAVTPSESEAACLKG